MMKLIILLLITLCVAFADSNVSPKFGKPELMFRGLSNMTLGVHSVGRESNGSLSVLFSVGFSDGSYNYFTRTLYANNTWSSVEWVVPYQSRHTEISGKILSFKGKQFITSVTRPANEREQIARQVTFRERTVGEWWDGGQVISGEEAFFSSFDVDMLGTVHVAFTEKYNDCISTIYRRKRWGEMKFEKPINVSSTLCNAAITSFPFIYVLNKDKLLYVWVEKVDKEMQIYFSLFDGQQWQKPQILSNAKRINKLSVSANMDRTGALAIWNEPDSHGHEKVLISFYREGVWSKPKETGIDPFRRVSTVGSSEGGYWILHATESDKKTKLMLERRIEKEPGRSLDRVDVVESKLKKSDLIIVEDDRKMLNAFWVEYDPSGSEKVDYIMYSQAKL